MLLARKVSTNQKREKKTASSAPKGNTIPKKVLAQMSVSHAKLGSMHPLKACLHAHLVILESIKLEMVRVYVKNVFKESSQYKDIKEHSTKHLENQQRFNEQILSALQRRVLRTPTVSLTKQS